MQLALLASLLSVGGVYANQLRLARHVQSRGVPDAARGFEIHTIDMPINHFPSSSRYAPDPNTTFKQRYVFDSTYYKPGGPVFLYIGGETSVESRFSNLASGIIKVLMSRTNGLGVILENRYYGESFPFATTSTDELRFLTNEQTIADNAYFAQHAQFPGVNSTSINAPQTPWILYGGSLAGAQTAFSLKQYGGDDGVLWGGIASSATTKASHTYAEWYDQYQRYGPQDCIGYLNGIVSTIDKVFDYGSAADIREMKSLFGLEALTDHRDFAMTIAFPLGGPDSYPTATWQELNWVPGHSSNQIFNFCSNITNDEAPESIRSVDLALSKYTNGEPLPGLGNYADYIRKHIVPLCKSGEIGSSACFGTQNATYWANTENGDDRSYLYTTCTESGLYQVANTDGPSLVANVLQADYTQQWCNWAFPEGEYNSIPSKPDISQWNDYGGYSVEADRLAHIDGEQDVWVNVCYHSPHAPKRRTTNARDAFLNPHYLITGAGHHWDSYALPNLEDEPQFIREAHKWEIRVVKRWLADFAKRKHIS
ncbi:hypothetical protein VHEMI07623 [[Torrubiella] hemipterigena]|uniref:Extracelular serine carboxypeptidase n=1 Tax=[Torrubiella] hemipterigena TaxID=1531966 RepID=A0A0A1T425_9HYPO|nr:hypothetical protein VHEMI07623 [[Torrubiella] hemipterigena]